MRRTPSPGSIATRRRSLALIVAALLGVVLAGFVTTAPAGAAPWIALPQPWDPPVQIRDVAAFPPAGVALAGAGGRVALSIDGGVTWTLSDVTVQSGGHEIEALDFTDASHGVLVGDGGLLLFTTDGGASWASPTVTGGAPGADLLTVDMAGLTGYAGGRGGTLLTTTDGGATWAPTPLVVTDDITAVAVAGNGAGMAGTAGGAILVGSGDTWQVVGTATQPIVDAVAATALAGQGPGLVVSSGGALSGSTDGVTLDWTLDAAGRSWLALASLGQPGGTLLMAGPGGAIDTVDATAAPVAAVARPAAGAADALRAAAPGGQSVAYVLGADDLLRRTLGAARAAPADTPVVPTAAVTAGSPLTLGPVAVHIAAPGTLLLESRLPGAAWTVRRSLAWSAADWGRSPSFSLSPTLNTSFRLRFDYGGRVSAVSDVSALLKVAPKLTPGRGTLNLALGAIYRFSGKVQPILPREPVQLWTDRGGAWHRIGLGGSVLVSSSGVWTSRRFGTPIAETYHLQARIAATARHAAGRSPVVTVTVR